MSSNQSDPHKAEDSTSRQAMRWWVLLHDESCSDEDCHRFVQWIRRSPVRVESYLRIAATMGALSSKNTRWPETSREALVEEVARFTASSNVEVLAPAETRNVPPLSDVHRPRGLAEKLVALWRGPTWLRWSPVALLLGACAVIIPLYTGQGPERFQTGFGEQRSVLLQDGSVVTLNTSSTIEARLGKHHRDIRLLAGEALFKVAKDPARPFDVTAGNATIRAVGTQFNVDLRATGTTVTVVEGKVSVTAEVNELLGEATASVALLSASERVTVSGSRVSRPEVVQDIAPVTAWTQRLVVFDRRKLEDVIAEFNRFSRQQIRIDNAALRDEEVTGVLQAGDTQALLSFLSAIPGVRITKETNGDYAVDAHQAGSAHAGGKSDP